MAAQMKPDIKRVIRNCVVDVDSANWNACVDYPHKENNATTTSMLWNKVYTQIYVDTMVSVLNHNSLHRSINEVLENGN